MNLEQELEDRFVCEKCEGKGGDVKRISTTGDGLSRLFNFQMHGFVAVSCNRCGYTEFYDRSKLEAQKAGMNVLDMIFGA